MGACARASASARVFSPVSALSAAATRAAPSAMPPSPSRRHAQRGPLLRRARKLRCRRSSLLAVNSTWTATLGEVLAHSAALLSASEGFGWYVRHAEASPRPADRDGGQRTVEGSGRVRRVGDARPHRVRGPPSPPGREEALGRHLRGRASRERRPDSPWTPPSRACALCSGPGGGARRESRSSAGQRRASQRHDATRRLRRVCVRGDDVTRASRSRRVHCFWTRTFPRGSTRAGSRAGGRRSGRQRRHRGHRVSSPRLPALPLVSAESPVRRDTKTVEGVFA